jgi:hypothetical protein
MHVRGVANIIGCTGQVISEYTIWAIPDPLLLSLNLLRLPRSCLASAGSM